MPAPQTALPDLPWTPDQQAELDTLQATLLRRKLHVAFLGQFSAGKSSLINALLDRPELLPTKARETTVVVTEVKRGEIDQAFIVQRDGSRTPLALAGLAAHIHGGSGAADVGRICVELADTALPADVVLVDTPGTNTVHGEHAETAALAIRDAEAAVYVFANAAFKAEDLAYLRQILQFQPNLFFVVNWIDHLVKPGSGEDVETLVADLERTLSRELGIEATVFATSATRGDGVVALRTAMFSHLRTRFDDLKQRSFARRVRRLVGQVQDHLANELQVLDIAVREGAQGLERQRRELAEQQAKVERMLARERIETMAKWRQIVRQRREQLARSAQSLKAEVVMDLERVGTQPEAEDYALRLQHKLVDLENRLHAEKHQLADAAIADLKTKTERVIAIEMADFSASTGCHWELGTPDLTQLDSRQQRKVQKLEAEFARLRQGYDELVAQVKGHAADGGPATAAAIDALQDELASLQTELCLPYEPRMVDSLRPDAVLLSEILRNIGTAVDVGVMVVPVLGQTSIVRAVAAQGLKGVTREVLKQTAKEVAQKVGEELGKAAKSQLPRALPPLSFRDLGDRIGQAFDRANHANNHELVEDPEHRRQFHGKRQQIELEYMKLERELKRKTAEKSQAKSEAEALRDQEVHMRQLIADKEQAFQRLERELEAERSQAYARQFREELVRQLSGFIDEAFADMERWLEAQSVLLETSITASLVDHYAGQFQGIQAQFDTAAQANGSQAAERDAQRKLAERQLATCTLYLNEDLHAAGIRVA